MYRQKDRFRVFALTLTSALLFIGCGGSSKSEIEPVQTVEKTTRISTYISKGNFVDVASFAYRKATDPSFAKYAMNIMLPGNDTSEIATPSTYDVTAITADNKLKKVVIQNYINTLEVKIVDGNRVNILLKDSEFTVDEVMSLDDFIARQ